MVFVNKLKEEYEIQYMNLPGFCKEPEPKNKGWNLSDYANFIEKYIKNNNFEPDFVLGYSFGGAVSLRWKTQYIKKTPIILMSTVIIRNPTNKNLKVKYWPNNLSFLRTILRNLYLIYIIKNPEMKYGTKFLRRTYQNIVRVDMTKELLKINPKEIKLIYRIKDEMVSPNLIVRLLRNKLL